MSEKVEMGEIIKTVISTLQKLGYTTSCWGEYISARMLYKSLNIELEMKIDELNNSIEIVVYSIIVDDRDTHNYIKLGYNWNLTVQIKNALLAFRYYDKYEELPKYIIIQSNIQELEQKIKKMFNPEGFIKTVEAITKYEIHEREEYIWQNLPFSLN